MRAIFVLAAFALSACAVAVPVGQPGADPEPTIIGEGETPDNQVVVYRPGQIGLVTNVATSPAILLNGDAIGTCRFGQPLVLRLPDGTWTITAMTANGQVSQEVTVAGGSRANLRCGTTDLPSLVPAPTLVPVGTETALVEAGL